MRNKLSAIYVFILLSAGTITAHSSPDHQLFTDILKTHVVNGLVDYQALKKDTRLATYLNTLSSTNPAKLPKPDQLAFWINAYNAWTLKLIVDHYPVKSIKDIGFPLIDSPWDKKLATINGKEYSLNEIEHSIIRKEFDEPRIHFAVVCAAISCPPLRSEAYTGDKLNDQLNDQVQAFFTDSKMNRADIKAQTIYLSKILDWYKDDFGTGKTYLSTIIEYFTPEIRKQLKPEKIRIEYLDYDWSLNIRTKSK